jgi:hypothetical protein
MTMCRQPQSMHAEEHRNHIMLRNRRNRRTQNLPTLNMKWHR